MSEVPTDISATPSPAAEARRQVPDYDVVEFGPRRSIYCVCIFVINEGTRIRDQLTRMQPCIDDLDVIIADGGSTDGSLDAAVLERTHVRTLLTKRGPGKLSAQMRMALDYAMTEGYAGVITIDGNNKDDPSALPLFRGALDHGFDHVQGSRYVPGGRAVNTPLTRHWGVKLLHAPLISLAARQRCTDTTNGFRAYSRRFILDERVNPFRNVFHAYELHYYLAIRSARLGFRTCEVPVTRAYPAHGKTPTKISPLKGNLLILRTLARACAHRFNP